MKQTLLIVLLSLAGFAALPATAADPAPAPEAAKMAAPDNLAAPGKPCPQHGMPGMPGMAGMQGMMMGQGHPPCPAPGAHCDCKHHSEMDGRIEQLQKRLDALQMTVEMLVREQGE